MTCLIHDLVAFGFLFSSQQQHAVPAGGQGYAHPPLRLSGLRASGGFIVPARKNPFSSDFGLILENPRFSWGQEVATDTCVYKRVLRKPAGEPKDLLKDAATDPSLPRHLSVNFDATAPTIGEQGLTLYFICCNPSCGHRWRD
ncbi:hypothetical protein PR202_gb21663 [Eleusine coracana subsp. coracana]|uniref:Uncharacterized protein n=1 Tax=Eleusine coracana subsp. coracana TaxID=191504 RepID=A0AAV5FBP8_ELECO|nr:hypothetical protein PR202_gb21663 [Eleusine coracana subsp. coracana]